MQPTDNKTIYSGHYSPLIGAILIFGFVCIAHIPIAQTLWRHSFDDGTYSHAYLIPIIFFYLLYEFNERGKLIIRENINWLCFAGVLFSGYLVFVSANAQISFAYWISLLLVLISAFLFVFRTNFYLLFACTYLVFLMPIWGILVPYLQELSIIAVSIIMGFTGIPTFIESRFIEIPSGTFEIAGGCSGLRYFITALAISSLYIALYISDKRKAMTFLLVAILGALITNWIRIVLLIVIGHFTEMESPLMEDHNSFGWYIFVPFMFLLFHFGNKLADQNTKPVTNTETEFMPNWTILVMLVVSILATSTSLRIINNESPQHEKLTLDIEPIINSYSTLATSQNEKTTTLFYTFNGTDLDNKPTYYSNSMIPVGWKKIDAKLIDQKQVMRIKKGNQTAEVEFSFQVGNFKTGSKQQFKQERVKKALLGTRKTQLYWQFSLCNRLCTNI